jgi:hypothetical protein
MKISIKLLLLFTLFFGAFTAFGQQNNIDFTSPMKTTKTDKHLRVEGTNIYGDIPSDFLYIKELVRYQKNDNLYIQVMDLRTSSFVKAKPNFTRQAMEAKGARIDVLNNIKLNEFDAIYVEGPSKYPDETKLMLIFGNDSFSVIILGVCKTADLEGKKELQKIMHSIYYDKSLSVDVLALANFEFDQSITNFKLAMTASNTFMYAKNGKDDAQNPTASSLLIGVCRK